MFRIDPFKIIHVVLWTVDPFKFVKVIQGLCFSKCLRVMQPLFVYQSTSAVFNFMSSCNASQQDSYANQRQTFYDMAAWGLCECAGDSLVLQHMSVPLYIN